jgi:hypothetical protein
MDGDPFSFRTMHDGAQYERHTLALQGRLISAGFQNRQALTAAFTALMAQVLCSCSDRISCFYYPSRW